MTADDPRHPAPAAAAVMLLSADARAEIARFMDAFSTLTLATCGPAGPWAAALFFARDERLRLYFISSRHSRHVQELLANGRVAVTINGDPGRWTDIRGVQLAGDAAAVPASRRGEAMDHYLRKFTEVRGLLAQPSTPDEQRIAAAFETSDFFCIVPRMIRLIDNARGFGHSSEYALERGA